MSKVLKTTLCMLLVTAICFSLTSCKPVRSVSCGKIKIVTTIFPEYDWVRNVVGDSEDFEVIWLLDDGVDLHNYQPTVKDIATISECDMLVHVGGAADEWIENAVKQSDKDIKVVNAFQVLESKVKEEEEVEGMQEEKGEHDEDEIEYDEHIWLSLSNAQDVTMAIAETISSFGVDNEKQYIANAKEYCDKLASLDKEYKEVCKAGKFNTILVADRFPYRYLTDDYGLKYYAAYAGCSAETEASFNTIIGLAERVDDLGLDYVIVTEAPGNEIAETIIKCTKDKNQKICILDSMQATSDKDVKNGTTYIGTMKDNLSILKECLN